MQIWEQRLTAWGAFISALIGLVLLLILEKDRFQNPWAAPVGIEWGKERLVGGKNTVPVQYRDVLTLTNTGSAELTNVILTVTNWANGTSHKVVIGMLPVRTQVRIDTVNLAYGFPPYPYEISIRDTLVVECDGYAPKRVTMKDVGKDKLLRDIEKEEDKEANADPDFWKKLWRWQDELHAKGAEPTQAMFQEWLSSKEAERAKK